MYGTTDQLVLFLNSLKITIYGMPGMQWLCHETVHKEMSKNSGKFKS